MAINNPVITDSDWLQATAVAIQNKDGGSKMEVPDFASRIDALPSGGATVKKAVNFYTFKGLAYSYTAEEAAVLTEMPEPPTIEGFTFQKWNGWTVEKIKTWLSNHNSGELSVGGLYVTTDGHTRIKMHLREPQMASFPMPFCIQQMAGTVVIDWGDGSTPETVTAAGVYSHTWQVNQYPADVVIDIDYTPSGSTKLVLGRGNASTTYGLFNNEPYYASCVTEVEYGANNDFSAYSATFKNCFHLKTINIPFGFSTTGSNTFYGCTNLALTVLPDGVTSIGANTFYGCTNLALTVLPDGVTSIGANTFYGCTNLALTVLPDGVTSIGSSAFQGCTNLTLTVLPDGVTSIGSSAFYGCTSLVLIVLPDGLTSIGIAAFQNCTNLYFIDLTKFTNPQSIPALANANAFQGIPAEAQYQVINQEMYDTFTSATNWNTFVPKYIIKGAN